MKGTKIPTSFIYPVITDTDRKFGASVSGPVLREDGDWRGFLPPTEEQRIRGIESSACYIEAQQHAVATLIEAQFGILDENYSARFNALLSGGTEHGGDPVAGAYSMNHDGLILDSSMPFGNEIQSWKDFHSWKGVSKSECIKSGKDYLKEWGLNYKIEVEREMPLETKYLILKEALKRSPVPISVTAWFRQGDVYIKPKGMHDNHLVEAVFVDDQNRIYVRDTYDPFGKILSPNFDFEFAISWVARKNDQTKSWWQALLEFLGVHWR